MPKTNWFTDMQSPPTSSTDQTLQKFLFTRSFTEGSPESYAKAKEPTYSQAQLDAAKEEAYQLGLAAGQKSETEKQQQHIASLLSLVGQKIGLLLAEAETARGQELAGIAEIATAIARKVMPHYTEQHGLQEITAILSQVLREMNREPRLVVRVSEAIFDIVSDQIKTLSEQHAYAGKVVVIAEANMAPSDCLVEWADGGIERDIKSLWQEIDRAMAQTAQSSAPPPTDNNSPSGE